jgi:CubicO group peptidase (beta-lactamase class C family)
LNDTIGPIRALLHEAIAARAFPAAVVEVGTPREVLWREAFGTLTYEADAPPAGDDTIFDLASLTKVLATTTLVMEAVEAGRLGLDDRVARWIPEWRSPDREAATLRDLLAHCSGLTGWLPLFRDHAGRADYQHAIATLPLEYRPRAQSVYSDLGFILLGFILEDAARQPLGDQAAALVARLELPDLAFRPPAAWRPRTAPTEIDPWRGRLLVGEVHDENCWALGGVTGHTGLFGSVAGVGRFARIVLQAIAGRGAPGEAGLLPAGRLREFLGKSDVPGSSRALGWDTMLPTSSCGTRLSAAAFGHTGFTGTSLWIDPVRGAYVVFLTNRVHPTRRNEAILAIRPRLHDAIVVALPGWSQGPVRK